MPLTPKSSGFDSAATVYIDDFEGSETNIESEGYILLDFI